MTPMRTTSGAEAEAGNPRAGIRQVAAHAPGRFAAAALQAVLAETATLLARTMASHWSAQGAGFVPLRDGCRDAERGGPAARGASDDAAIRRR